MNNATTLMTQYFKSQGLKVNLQKYTIERDGRVTKVEPMVMDLLQLLINQPNQVVEKNMIIETLWQGKYVNEEALTKLVSKLRKALGDDSKSPQYIRTIPKKGYELLYQEPVGPKLTFFSNKSHLWLPFVATIFLFLLWFFINRDHDIMVDESADSQQTSIDRLYKRANSHYYQYSRAENESAIQLYEKIMASEPDHALSQSGLANALVQQLIRWPESAGQPATHHTDLLQSIEQGRLTSVRAHNQLDRAEGLAQRATVLAPDNAIVHRSLGLVYAAQQKFDLAKQQYLKAIELDANEWGAMINLSDICNHEGDAQASLEVLKQAHMAMTRVYEAQEVIIRPWYHKLAVIIAQKNQKKGDFAEAEIWFRQILDSDPFNQDATIGLSQVLRHYGDNQGAKKLCTEFKEKINPEINC